jgi:hypothetical protein
MPANDKTSAPIIRGVRCPSLPRMHTKVRGAKHPEPKHPVGLPAGSPAQTPCAAVRRASGVERPTRAKSREGEKRGKGLVGPQRRPMGAAPLVLLAKHPVGPPVGGPARPPGAAIRRTLGAGRPTRPPSRKGEERGRGLVGPQRRAPKERRAAARGGAFVAGHRHSGTPPKGLGGRGPRGCPPPLSRGAHTAEGFPGR